MNQSIYTIPIQEVFEPMCGCPICTMRDMLEERCLEYIMGASMMEPDVRIQTNKLGFCKDHLDMMKKRNNKLALALMLETHLDELENKHVISKARSKKDPISPAHTCFVCNEIEDAMSKIIQNLFKLYSCDKHFQELFSKQEYFCYPHFDMLCEQATILLNKKQIEPFTDIIAEITRLHLVEIAHDVHTFSTMFDYRNSGNTPDENVTNSVDRAIAFLTAR